VGGGTLAKAEEGTRRAGEVKRDVRMARRVGGVGERGEVGGAEVIRRRVMMRKVRGAFD